MKGVLSMPTLETYYLIDFENVHEDGLSGSNKLGTHDHIHIFLPRTLLELD